MKGSEWRRGDEVQATEQHKCHPKGRELGQGARQKGRRHQGARRRGQWEITQKKRFGVTLAGYGVVGWLHRYLAVDNAEHREGKQQHGEQHRQHRRR